ncbi:uncharacterized protein KY384_002930 [Bacidia gigantensis]|uniref:uncharacterized protein n=1 Tax=Bacidia gigantensis TaxID=2732470 RepID=UPI001D036A49|nr:uncharacterized protein KY384_002930 [Bacidia gigantensis]KAG8531302.1 hypothetical protein KY384_002930 [Bacidia gigantensis]
MVGGVLACGVGAFYGGNEVENGSKDAEDVLLGEAIERVCAMFIYIELPGNIEFNAFDLRISEDVHARLSTVSGFQVEDLQLIHHYTTSTYLTIAGPEPFVQEAWQIHVPREAYQHPYLMHSILGLAALHLHHTEGHQSWHESATRHYNLALSSSKHALSNVNEGNCRSLFAFSGIIVILALDLPLGPPGHKMISNPVSELVQISTLVRGSKHIVDSSSQSLRTGTLAALIPDGFL